MERHYEFKYTSKHAIEKIDPEDVITKEQMEKYKENFHIIRYFMSMHYTLNAFHIKYLYNDGLSTVFEIKNGKQTWKLILQQDKIYLNSKREAFTIKQDNVFSENRGGFNILSMTYKNRTQTLEEELFPHKIQLTLSFSNGISFIFVIPVAKENSISPSIFQTLTSNQSLSSLIHFYRYQFLPMQSKFDLEECKTIIAIKNQDFITDYVELINNKIKSYEISAKNGNVVITLKDGEFIIKGFDKSINLNKEVQILQKRLHKLM